ncbi:MAG: hypothetical protein ACOX3T_05745 [Bdellovibrionota bacterium]
MFKRKVLLLFLVSLFINNTFIDNTFISNKFFSNIANAESLVGISAFPIKSKQFGDTNCKRVIEMANKSQRPAIAILYSTFGNDTKCLKKFWKSARKQSKRHLTEIHFSNEAGRRSGNVSERDFLRKYKVKKYNRLLEEMPPWLEERIRKRVGRINIMIRDYTENGDFILSTGLEDNYTQKAWDNLYAQIKKHWRHDIARSTVRRKQKVENLPLDVWDERHAYSPRYYAKIRKPGRCIMNGDGQDIDFLSYTGQRVSSYDPATYREVKTWLRKGIENNCIMFLWVAKWQGIIKNKPASSPMKRKVYYHKEDIPIISTFVTGEVLSKGKRKK